ncbi:hypothetical protein Tco_1067335 [Tanacetum coccineum]|uniref:Uncharacterized protein n=1 Tax=Tanacetum coccineum TaxID=301880 RepID=A0ABQ5HCT1_9ASTR
MGYISTTRKGSIFKAQYEELVNFETESSKDFVGLKRDKTNETVLSLVLIQYTQSHFLVMKLNVCVNMEISGLTEPKEEPSMRKEVVQKSSDSTRLLAFGLSKATGSCGSS